MELRLRTLLATALVGAGGMAVGHLSVQDSAPRDTNPSLSAEHGEQVPTSSEDFDPALRQLILAIDTADGDDAAMARLVEEATTYLEHRIVISRWVRSNPLGAVDALGNKSHMVFEEWARIDPNAAIAAARTDTSNRAGQFATGVLNGLAAAHPDVFFDAIAGWGNARPSGAMWDQAFSRLFGENPAKAIEAFRELSETHQRASIVSFGRHWANVDPQAALKWAEGSGNHEVVQAVVNTIAVKDPLAALRREKVWDSVELRTAVDEGFAEWSSSQLIDAMLQLKSEGNEHGHVWKSFQERFLKEHRGRPEAACAQIDSIQDEELRNAMSSSYASNCSVTDAAVVLPWLEQQSIPEHELKAIATVLSTKLFDPTLKNGPIPGDLVSLLHSGPLRDSLQKAIDADRAVRAGDYATFAAWQKMIGGTFMARDPFEQNDRARTIVQSHLDRIYEQSPSEAAAFAASLRGDGITLVLADWFRSDPDALRNWVANPPDGISATAQKQSAAGLVQIWAAEDPAAAGAWVATLTDEVQQGAAIDRLAYTWARQNPTGAVAWAAALDDAETRARASGVIARNWLNADPYGATEWLDTLERGEVRDRTLAGMIPEAGRYFGNTLTLEDKTALHWLSDMDDTTLRRETLLRFFRWEDWIQEDDRPERLAATLASSGISEDDIRAIRTDAERRQVPPSEFDDDPFGGQ